MSYDIELTWARGAVDPSNGIFKATNYAGDGTLAWSSEPLPDMVLAPGSYVEFQRYSATTISVDLLDIAVAYTVGAGPAATVDAVSGIPLLTDVSTG